jgi:hypothetical protein
MMNDKANELRNIILDNFNSNRVLSNLAPTCFYGFDVSIPWYLKPFTSVINNIANKAFNDGVAVGRKSDTVTFKRPVAYKQKETTSDNIHNT